MLVLIAVGSEAISKCGGFWPRLDSYPPVPHQSWAFWSYHSQCHKISVCYDAPATMGLLVLSSLACHKARVGYDSLHHHMPFGVIMAH